MVPSAAPPPNIVLICCDQLRWDWLGCNGHPLVQTPQIDKLAHQGLNFQRAFSECPASVPARRILMTGQDSFGVHMTHNRDRQPFPEGPKLAEVLTRAGWQTFATGKLYAHPQRNRIGFEEVLLNEEGRLAAGGRRDDYERWLRDHGYSHRPYSHGLGNNQYGLRLSPLPEEATTTHWTAQRAMEFLERRDPTRPFFLHVSFDKPHPPITPPAQYYELYRDSEFPAPVMGAWLEHKCPPRILQSRHANDWDTLRRRPAELQQSLRGVAAMITHLDSMIGTLMGQLREEGVAQDTWVILTSDHGDQLFDHGAFGKGDFFHGSARIPLIVCPSLAWRKTHGLIPGRNDTETPAGLMDIMPTILDACDLFIPTAVKGQSLLPVIGGQPRTTAYRPHVVGQVTSHFGVSDGRFRYQWIADEGWEYLFDQDADPCDEHDLADDPAHADKLAELRAHLVAWLERHGDLHVEGGQLRAQPREWHLEDGRSINLWNNRGRH